MQSLVLVRHGKSMANEWKDKMDCNGGRCFLGEEEAAANGLFNAALSIRGVVGCKHHGNTLWGKLKALAADGDRPIVVYSSPIKRALQTCLMSMMCAEVAPRLPHPTPKHTSPIPVTPFHHPCLTHSLSLVLLPVRR
jgi:bisphosphoglycerate-dependent phosphoglycerate mutase